MKRGYSSKQLLTGQSLLFFSFPVFIQASIYAFLGIKKGFTITEKTNDENRFNLKIFWPQVLIMFISFSACIWGVNRAIYEKEYLFAIISNLFWSFFNFFNLFFAVFLGKFFKYKKQLKLMRNILSRLAEPRLYEKAAPSPLTKEQVNELRGRISKKIREKLDSM